VEGLSWPIREASAQGRASNSPTIPCTLPVNHIYSCQIRDEDHQIRALSSACRDAWIGCSFRAACSRRALQPCWNVVLGSSISEILPEWQAFSWMPRRWSSGGGDRVGSTAAIWWGVPSIQEPRYPHAHGVAQQPACLEAPPAIWRAA
jgi:hypothetical protein